MHPRYTDQLFRAVFLFSFCLAFFFFEDLLRLLFYSCGVARIKDAVEGGSDVVLVSSRRLCCGAPLAVELLCVRCEGSRPR